MKNKILVSVGIIIILIGGIFLLSNLQNEAPIVKKATASKEAPVVVSEELPVPSPGDTKKKQAVSQVKVPEKIEKEENEIREMVQGKEMVKNKFREIAQNYERNLTVPIYARPINEQSYSFLNPNAFVPTRRKMRDEAPFSYEIILPKISLFKGTPVPVTFRIFAEQSVSLPQMNGVKSEIFSGTKLVATFEIEQIQNDEMEQSFFHEFAPTLEESQNWQPFLRMRTTFNLSGYPPHTLMTSFRYEESIAQITGKGTESVEGPHLLIPLNLSVSKPGVFVVSANLFSETTQSPLLHIEGREKFSALQGTVTLKAHISGLKARRDPGPYLLKTFLIHRESEGTGANQIGDAEKISFVIPKHEFAEYKDEPYSHPAEQRKLKQLKKLMGNMLQR